MKLFAGVAGRAVAPIMARGNADMERQAIDVLAPEPHHAVLELGCGPGVGLKALAQRLTGGWVAGIDPSDAMLRSARARNRDAVRHARVRLARTPAHELPFDDATFDGAIAVNSVQLWEPFEASVAEVTRVLRPGALLVTLTHDWALKHHADSVDAWLARAEEVFERCGFDDMRKWTGHAKSGGTVGFSGRRA